MATRLRPVWRHVPGAALLAGLLWLMLRWFEHANVYQPTRTLVARADALGRPFEEARFAARDGTRLHGWFFPAAADSPRRHLAVLHCHGNGGNLSHRLDVAAALLETGVNVLLFDYRGYGLSAGRPSEEGTYLDAEAAHAWLVARGFAASDIIAFGESLGGGVAAELARRVPLAGLVLQSTFTSIPDLGAELFPFLPVRWLARIRYDTLAKLPHLRVPVLVMHGRGDTLVRFAHAERNFAAAHPPKRLVELAGDHNDFLEAGRAVFRDGFAAWLAELPAALPPSRAVAP
jgi:fermentation-respiration switch protein FrsA (DUF1100 family)